MSEFAKDRHGWLIVLAIVIAPLAAVKPIEHFVGLQFAWIAGSAMMGTLAFWPASTKKAHQPLKDDGPLVV